MSKLKCHCSRCEKSPRRPRRIRRGRLLGIGEVIDDTTDDLAGGVADELDDLAELAGLGLVLRPVDSMFVNGDSFVPGSERELQRKRRTTRRLRALLRKRTRQCRSAKRVAVRGQARGVSKLRSLAVEKGRA